MNMNKDKVNKDGASSPMMLCPELSLVMLSSSGSIAMGSPISTVTEVTASLVDLGGQHRIVRGEI